MPNNTFSLRPWVEWKEPLPRMDGPLYKFQVCWSSNYSVRVLSDVLEDMFSLKHLIPGAALRYKKDGRGMLAEILKRTRERYQDPVLWA